MAGRYESPAVIGDEKLLRVEGVTWKRSRRASTEGVAGVQLYQNKNLMKKKNILSVSLTLRDLQRNNLRGLSLRW